MNPRMTALLFVVASLLGAFVYFYEIRGEEGRKQAETEAKRIFPGVEEAAVTAVWLTTGDGAEARVERRDGAWRVVEPVDFPADAIAVDGMVSTIVNLTSDGVLDDPQPPEVYGLAETAEIFYFDADGEQGVRMGRKTPVGSNSYVARLGDDRVYMVPSWRLNSLKKELDDIRDRKLLDFDAETVERIVVSWPDGGVELEKRDGVWWVAAPVETRADDATVDELLSELGFIRADGFVDEPPPDAETGLDRPEFSAVLTLRSDDGSVRELPFAIGSVQGDKTRLARATQTALYSLPEDRLEDFPRKVVAYRFKRLSEFDVADADTFELSFHDADGSTSIVQGERVDSGWETTPDRMAAGKARHLLDELANLRGVDIVTESMPDAELSGVGLDPPRVRMRVWGAAAEGEDEAALLADVAIGDIDAELGIVARAQGDPRVYRIDLDLGEHLPVSREAFSNRFLSQETGAGDAGEVDVEALGLGGEMPVE